MKKNDGLELINRYGYLDLILDIQEDVTKIFSPAKKQELNGKIQEILMENPNIVRLYSQKRFAAIEEIFYNINDNKSVSHALRSGMSTVLTKIVYLSEIDPKLVDQYLVSGHERKGQASDNINEEFARLLILATSNDYSRNKTFQKALQGKTKLNANIDGSLHPGVSIAVSSYINNDDDLQKFADSTMYGGFYKEFNCLIADIDNYKVYRRLWYWSETFNEKTRLSKIKKAISMISDLNKRNLSRVASWDIITEEDAKEKTEEYNTMIKKIGKKSTK